MTDAWTQTVPPSVDPGRIQKRLQPRPTPEAKEKLVVPKVKEQELPPELEQVKFVLTGISLEGNTVFSEADFLPLWQPLLSKLVPLKDIFDIAAKITAKYRNEGYVLSQAIVPPQEIIGGVARIRIIEGYVNDVIIRGDIRGRRSLLTSRGEKIKASRPLHSDDLERYLLLINDLPGVSARSVLKPSATQPGAADLEIIVGHKTLDGFALVDNRGDELIGPIQERISLTANSVLGLYEDTQVQLGGADGVDELKFGTLFHSQQIGSEGTKIFASGSYVETHPESTGPLAGIEVDGRSFGFSAGVSHRFIRSRSRNLTVTGLFDWLNSETEINDIKVTDDRIRAVRLGATYDFVDSFRGVNLVGLQVNQGIDGLGARGEDTTLPSRANGDEAFTKFNARVSRLQNIVPGWSVLVEAVGQYSRTELLAPEEFGFGGEEFGRGFDSSEFVGDHGIALKGELQYSRALNWRFLQSYQAFLFGDWGHVWRKDASRDPGGATDDAASVGGGLRLNMNEHFSGSLEVAQPLFRTPVIEEDRDPRVFFSVVGRL